MSENNRWVRYPLSHRFTLAADAPRAAQRVRALAGASSLGRELLDRVGAATILAAGTSVWPTVEPWPWPAIGAADLQGMLDSHLRSVVLLGAAVPRQPGRHRLSLLARCHDHEVVVKLGGASDGLEIEALALQLLATNPLPGIETPHVLASGTLADDITFIATEAKWISRQRRAIGEPLSTFEEDLARSLAALPRPAGTASDAVPVHGDLAPWNLRRTPYGLALYDWEAAGWGAPGSDLATYRAACASLHRWRIR